MNVSSPIAILPVRIRPAAVDCIILGRAFIVDKGCVVPLYGMNLNKSGVRRASGKAGWRQGSLVWNTRLEPSPNVQCTAGVLVVKVA